MVHVRTPRAISHSSICLWALLDVTLSSFQFMDTQHDVNFVTCTRWGELCISGFSFTYFRSIRMQLKLVANSHLPEFLMKHDP